MKLKVSDKLKAFVNDLIKEFPCRMVEVRGKFLYLLNYHHKYTNFKDAPRIKLGPNDSNKDGYYYLHTVL